MLRSRLNKIIFGLLLFLPSIAAAQYDIPAQPEAMYATDPTRFTAEDENRDGVRTRTVSSAEMTASGDDWTADFVDFQCVGLIVPISDATADNGFAVTKTSPDFQDGECAIRVDDSATLYGWVLIRNQTGRPTNLYVKQGASNGVDFQQQNRSVIQTTDPYAWRLLTDPTTGEPRTFSVSSATALYFKFEQNVFLQSFYLTPDAPELSTPCTPGNCGGVSPVQPDITVRELGAADAPTSYNHATFNLDSVARFIFTGVENGVPCGGNYSAKIIWEDGATKWGYLSVDCPDDPVSVVSAEASDSTAIFGVPIDKAVFRWRTPADLLTVFNSAMRDIRAMPDDKFTDGDWSGAGDTLTLTPDFIDTVIGNLTGTGWNLFVKFNLGAIVADTVGKCQLVIYDRDASPPTSSVYWRGNSETNATQFGNCKWSSEEVVTAPPDTPMVSGLTFPPGQITTSSAQGTATTTVAGTCRLYARQSTGVTAANATKISSGSLSTPAGGCSEALTGLTAGVWFAIMGVENTGNPPLIGYSSEVSFTISPALSGTHFAKTAATGSGDCSSYANAGTIKGCLDRADFTAGSRLFVEAGTRTAPKVYTGPNGMIRPPVGKSGVQGKPITVYCDGQSGSCLINGQRIAGNKPLYLDLNNSWWVIDGFNFANAGLVNGNYGTADISDQSNHNIVRNFVVWDRAVVDGVAFTNNGPGFGTNHSTNNLIEDGAQFGTSRKILTNAQFGDNFRGRRLIGIYNGSNDPGPKDIFEVGYNSVGSIYENVFGFWHLLAQCNTQACQRQSFSTLISGSMKIGPALPPVGSFYHNRLCTQNRILGSAAIYKKQFRLTNGMDGSYPDRQGGFGRSVDCFLASDLLFVNEGHPNVMPYKAWMWELWDTTAATTPPCQFCDRKLQHFTHVGHTVPASHILVSPPQKFWDMTDFQPSETGTYSAYSTAKTAGAWPFRATRAGGSGKGAWICKRIVNGVETNEPLFPLPVEAQLKAALDYANKIGDHPHDSTFYFGKTGLMTDMLETDWGAMASGCKN